MSFKQQLRIDLSGPDDRCVVIGEIAQAHDGSLGMAHAYIDVVSETGADAVKFQTHIAAAESTPGEPWRVKFSPQDETRYDYWKRMEFTEEQWLGLKEHAEQKGLLFLSSPFSLEAVDLLERLGVRAWKVASGEINNPLLIRRMMASGVPMIFSSGMSSWTELDKVVDGVKEKGLPLAVLQCTSAYPCTPRDVGLNMIPLIRERYGCAAGLSDHSGTIFPALAAAALGAEVIEVHVTMSRDMFGPDVGASVTKGELAQLVQGVRDISTMLTNPVDKDRMAAEMAHMRQLFTKSVVASVAIPSGAILTEAHLAAKKPGSGIPAERIDSLVGKRVLRDYRPDEFLREEDLEPGD